jgi:hypothetical protein
MPLRSSLRLRPRRASLPVLAAAFALAIPSSALAEVPPQRTFHRLASSNGHGALLLDLSTARLTHFREHLFATEEPEIDASGNEIWDGSQFGSIRSRDILYDAYFGLRSGGSQRWLTSAPVDADASGYAPWAPGKTGGTGVVTMVQKGGPLGALEATQYFFAPRALAHAGFVMAMRVKNTGAAKATGAAAFSLHNFHMGYGRPGVMTDIGENGETITLDKSNGKTDFIERAFAGVVVARALGQVEHLGTAPAENVFATVDAGGSANLSDAVNASYADASVSAFQYGLGDIDPGAEKWVGVAFAHHGDPFAGSMVQGWLDAYVGGKGAKELVDAEIASWASFQADTVKPPAELTPDEETLLRQSAVMLQMGQVREEQTFLREFKTSDSDPRYTRFGASPGAPPVKLPATVVHRGKGAVIASLPPGEWTYAWIRDGAYATTAMAALGMQDEARDSLRYYMNAEAGRFQAWDELKPYSMPPYQISLVRYHGFGVEETDFNEFGPNLEFDGFGLFLWALRSYEKLTGDTALADEVWGTASTKVADVLLALIDPETGLIRRDSSIWETHWKGRERSWTYTSITAARGLCDAAEIAERVGDVERAALYKKAGMEIRAAIAARLTDASGALASNAEELATGSGYWDAAVLDGIAMGLFDPKGRIASATLKGLDEHLIAPAGAGWSRNDDRTDHNGGNDMSPWGSEYDSAEWVVTDLRGAVATRLMGDAARSDRLLAWVQSQSLINYLAVAETYDEGTGKYKFNAPMLGFGAGAYALALAARAGVLVDPACGAYYIEGPDGAGGAAPSSSSGSGATTGSGGSGDGDGEGGGCGCRYQSGPFAGALSLSVSALAIALLSLRRARARGRRS